MKGTTKRLVIGTTMMLVYVLTVPVVQATPSQNEMLNLIASSNFSSGWCKGRSIVEIANKTMNNATIVPGESGYNIGETTFQPVYVAGTVNITDSSGNGAYPKKVAFTFNLFPENMELEYTGAEYVGTQGFYTGSEATRVFKAKMFDACATAEMRQKKADEATSLKVYNVKKAVEHARLQKLADQHHAYELAHPTFTFDKTQAAIDGEKRQAEAREANRVRLNEGAQNSIKYMRFRGLAKCSNMGQLIDHLMTNQDWTSSAIDNWTTGTTVTGILSDGEVSKLYFITKNSGFKSFMSRNNQPDEDLAGQMLSVCSN